MQVTALPDRYELSFAIYDPSLVDFCRGLQQAKWNPDRKVWTAARNMPNALDLREAGYFNDLEVTAPVSTKVRGTHEWTMVTEPMAHQRRWAMWCNNKPQSLLCAEMGTGKTFMAMMWLKQHWINPFDVLVICPSSLIQHWANEFKMHTGFEAVAVSGTPVRRREALAKHGLHIINYEYLTLNEQAREQMRFKKCVILDESHKIKDPRSQRSKTLHKFCAGKFWRILLTGTPVSQGAQDYYSQFKVINPGLLGSSFTAFKARYCIQEQVRGAPIGVSRITGYRKLDELTQLIAPYTFNLLKKDCLDLPEKQYTIRFVDLSDEQRKVYNTLKREMAVEFKDETIKAANILTRMMKLSQVTQGFLMSETEGGPDHEFDNPKIKALADLIEELPPDEPLIIICRFLKDMENVSKLLVKLGITHSQINGAVAPEARQEIVNRFQLGDFRMLVGQIQTMGLGFTMTRANKMVFFSNGYSLTDRVQCEDRIHRIGATGPSCLYIDLVANNTIDEHIIRAIRSKADVAQMLTNMRLEICS